MKKINSIKFKNFKAFYGEETLQLDGKNLLVYGENGSGKSSIFWGLYTFLQSSTKPLSEITKYFVNANQHPDSIKNVFAAPASDSYIEIETVADGGVTTKHKIDDATANTNLPIDTTIAIANASSDFINYKLLYNFYNVTHKHDLNLWQVFMRDIFPYFRNNEFQKYYKGRIDDILSGVPMSSGGTKISRIGGRPQVEYVNIITALNNDIDLFINEVEQNANQFLKEHFCDNKDVLRLHLNYNRKIDYDSVRYDRKDNYSINLKLEIRDKTTSPWITIERPHSFLNEAQLTRIAIAVRFGALQTRLFTGDYKILCLDDMLISLDMGNRDKVIQLVLNVEDKPTLRFFDSFQKIIFTHDKGFFNLCKQRIRLSGKESDWINKEIYLDTDKVPQRPFIDNSTDYFQRAEKHLKAFDYPAAANALRQGFENLIFEFLPENERYALNKEGVLSVKTLDGMLSSLKQILQNHNQNINMINDLFIYKDHLLNPLSHNNLKTAVYKLELQQLLSIVPIFESLKTTVLKNLLDIPTIIKFIDTNIVTGNLTTYYISIRENLIKYKLLDGKDYINKAECIVVKSILPDSTEIIHNHHCKNIKDCARKIAYNLGTTYADDTAILSKLVL